MKVGSLSVYLSLSLSLSLSGCWSVCLSVPLSLSQALFHLLALSLPPLVCLYLRLPISFSPFSSYSLPQAPFFSNPRLLAIYFSLSCSPALSFSFLGCNNSSLLFTINNADSLQLDTNPSRQLT